MIFYIKDIVFYKSVSVIADFEISEVFINTFFFY